MEWKESLGRTGIGSDFSFCSGLRFPFPAFFNSMQDLTVQGRRISPADRDQIQGLLAAHPGWSRRRLSQELCSIWNWRNGVGQIKDMAARSLLVKLEHKGWIELPAR